MYRHETEAQGGEQRRGDAARQQLGEPKRQQYNDKVKRDFQQMPSDRIESDQMVAEAKPDIFERAIVCAVSDSIRAEEPPDVTRHRFPQERPLADITIVDDHRMVVVD